ncbi:MAG: hypothetical protein HOL90_00220, partial [Candidatus Nitrosopelagicus sp.]|nr:hypothetical protein [Candidatus Nitrosopelagicus sp.]
NGKKDGLYTYWYENGQKTYEAIFDNGELISEKFQDIIGTVGILEGLES